MPRPNLIARCPFYQRENQTTIYCESSVMGDDRYNAVIFRSEAEKMEHMRKYCCQYPAKGCKYAEMMDEMYEERERMNLRGKLKQAKKKIDEQEKIIIGLERSGEYMKRVVTKADEDNLKKLEELRVANELLQMILDAVIIEYNETIGELVVYTEKMKEKNAEYDVKYDTDKDKHLLCMSAKKKA